MVEIWKPVVGYEGLYEVSNTGEVRSLFRYKKLLKPTVARNGYCAVELFKNKKRKHILVHRLVALAFIPNPDNLPMVNHKDETRDNNCVENLEWCTAKYNMNFGTLQRRRCSHTDYKKEIYAENARKNGKKVCKPVSQFTKSGDFLHSYESGKEAHRKTGVSHSHILECCAGKVKTAGGYVWKYERNDGLLAR